MFLLFSLIFILVLVLYRVRPIRVKRPMFDVLVFRRKNSDV